jgi:NTE family protein
MWRRLRTGDVFRPIVPSTVWAALRGFGQLLHLPGTRLTSLLDTTPLSTTARDAVDWNRLRRNISDGLVELVVVATSTEEGRTVVFVDRDTGYAEDKLPPPDEVRGIDYVGGPIGPGAVIASAAIPVLFPPQRLDDADGRRGWFIDGGVRLNAPLKPAIELLADHLVVVATHPVSAQARSPVPPSGPPDADDAVVALMDATLVDRMVEDVRTLGKVNEAVAGGGDPSDRRKVPYLFVGPEQRRTIAGLAIECMQSRNAGLAGLLRSLTGLDLSMLAWLVAGDGPRRGDLLSYLFFDPIFAREAIELGQADARAALGPPGSPIPWLISARRPTDQDGNL